jgi:hypothetical protein
VVPEPEGLAAQADMPKELRCPGRIHARLIIDEVEDSDIKPRAMFEVKCRSIQCGARSGVVVLHYYDADTLDPIETKIRKEPAGVNNNRKER